jgi:hypothetical protein
MNTRHLLLTTVLAAAFGPFAAAADAQPARPEFFSAAPLVSVLDLDRDGVISAVELRNAAITLSALDLDGDGALSPAELAGQGQPARARRLAPATLQPVAFRPAAELNVLVQLDANGDGTLQLMEIANAASSLQRLDANHDGVLTRDEVRPVQRV